jgi:uncharacterized protein YmfQ (DUF2313 family)
MSAPLPSPRDAGAYARQFRQLLPRGAAWDFPIDGTFAGLIAGLAEEFARIDNRARDLIEEADPRTTLELLADWERVVGLPDNCSGEEPDNATERQVALHEKLTKLGAQNATAYKEMAARLGYAIDVIEHRPFRTGARVGDRVNSLPWTFVWTVNVRPFEGWLEEATFIAHLKAGDPCGLRLRGFGALSLECVIERAKPAHTHVLFAYEIEPTPVLWVDFTS